MIFNDPTEFLAYRLRRQDHVPKQRPGCADIVIKHIGAADFIGIAKRHHDIRRP